MIKRLSTNELQKIFYKEKERLDQLPQDLSNMYARGTALYLLDICNEIVKRYQNSNRLSFVRIKTIMFLTLVMTEQIRCCTLTGNQFEPSDAVVSMVDKIVSGPFRF